MSRFVVMGVSGCGKSLIGQAFAAAIGATFIDGDSLHPSENIAKMSRGEPLNDTDRAPWLHKVGDTLAMDGTVVACSALKRIYRDQIRTVAGAPITFLFLRGTRDTLLQRMSVRPGHFMPPALLDSQLATLQPPTDDEAHLVADIEQTPDKIVESFRSRLERIPQWR
jgi:gluconokinase